MCMCVHVCVCVCMCECNVVNAMLSQRYLESTFLRCHNVVITTLSQPKNNVVTTLSQLDFVCWVVTLNKGEYLKVREYKGATLYQLAKLAGKHLDNYPFDVVYIAGGACDITKKDNCTNKISFEWPTEKWSMSEHLLNTLTRSTQHQKWYSAHL